MAHIGKLRHLLAILKLEGGNSDYDDDVAGSPEPDELQYTPSRWSRSPEPAGQWSPHERWSASPERATVATTFGSASPDAELLQLLARVFSRKPVAEMVRIRWSLKTVADLHSIPSEEIEEVLWLEASEKVVLRRLCGCE